MNRTGINWGYGKEFYTWNPVVGCLRGCEYCYAAKIRKRFSKVPFTSITYYKNRLLEPMKAKRPATIFVGSMSDIEYWEIDYTKKILGVCQQSPWHTYMFLSKNPISYAGYDWPENCLLGLTMTCTQTQHCQYENCVTMIRYRRAFLSVEPILGTLKIWKPMHLFEKVIVGAMTGQCAVKPKPEWIQSIKDNVPSDKIFWKSNIKEYL